MVKHIKNYSIDLLIIEIKEKKDIKILQYFIKNQPEIFIITYCRLKQFKNETLENGSLETIYKEDLILRDLKNIIKSALSRKKYIEKNRLPNEIEKQKLKKAMILSNFGHEMRTPLNAIMGMSEMLKTELDENQTESIRKYFSILDEASKRLLGIVNGFTEVSQVETGEIELRHSEFNFPSLIKDIKYALISMAREKSNHVEYRFLNTLPEIVRSDQAKLKQALMNIVSNAIKFTENGNVFIEVVSLDKNKDIHKIEIRIRDEGIGIDQRNKKKIFEQYYQKDLSSTRKFGGIGTGLSFSKAIITALGGRLTVKSELGKGSTFICHLDIKEIVQIQPKEVPAKVLQLPKLKILFVDDSEENKMVFKVFMKQQDVEVKYLENGLEAFEEIKLNVYDLVLLDMQMPVMDGYTAAQKIREYEKMNNLQHTPIAALTASVLDSDRQKAMLAGCDYFIPKPFKKDSIINDILALLELKGEKQAS